MDKAKARKILKAKYYGDRDKSIKLIDEAIDFLLAQPEVIYCKDCKNIHNDVGEVWCGKFDGGIGTDLNDFCSYAIRRAK